MNLTFARSLSTWAPRKATLLGISALALLLLTTSARADELVTNGGFEETTNGGGQLGYNTNATGWYMANSNSDNTYTFLFTPGSADTTGQTGVDGGLSLWGSNNGGVDSITSSPDGGNFIGSDPSYQVSAIDQDISGLIPGETYVLTFYWAAAQQSGFNGSTTEGWQVSLGSETQSTRIYDLANHSFSGWMEETFGFTATSDDEVLSFLSLGGPSSGQPPFSLLDGVSLTQAPEMGTLPLLLTGILLGMGLLGLKARKKLQN